MVRPCDLLTVNAKPATIGKRMRSMLPDFLARGTFTRLLAPSCQAVEVPQDELGQGHVEL